MDKFTEEQVVAHVMSKTEGADVAEVEKKLTEHTWIVLVAIEDGEMMGIKTYKFRRAFVDVSGDEPRILGLWT